MDMRRYIAAAIWREVEKMGDADVVRFAAMLVGDAVGNDGMDVETARLFELVKTRLEAVALQLEATEVSS